jgi:Ca2+ transporting ATPase
MCVLIKRRDVHADVDSDQQNGAFAHVDYNFDIDNEALGNLMKLRGREGIEKIKEKYEGVNGLAQLLHTDIVNGLTGDEKDLKKRVDTFGKNEIPPKAAKTFIELVFNALKDPTLIILIICAFVSIGLSFYHPPEEAVHEEKFVHKEKNLEWIEGAAIFIAIIVVVFVTAFNDWRKEKQFRGLQDRIEKESNAAVIRNGKVIQINIKDLVVGDLCCIKYGDLLPADGVVVQSSDIKIDESSLTGETDLIKKNENDVSLLAGTHVMEGSGKYIVTAVGLNSQTGIIFQLLGATKDDKKAKKKKNEKKGIFFLAVVFEWRLQIFFCI